MSTQALNTLVSMRQMLSDAIRGGYAVGQFNITNLEFAQAFLKAAKDHHSPVILAVSEGYISYLGGLETAAAMVKSLIAHLDVRVPVALHLDHGSSAEVCLRALEAGFTSVMIDASHHPLEKNIEETRKVVQAAKAYGASVEAELGRISGKEDDLMLEESEASFADPEECVRLVQETGVDALAPALGSVHGPYRGKPRLAFGRMKEIHERTGMPLVLHGGSGLPDDDIRRAIACGTAKINVNTENQMAFTAEIRRYLSADQETYDPRSYLKHAREAVERTAAAKMQLFGSVDRVKV